ncbi:14-3-3-like protein GF14 mu [Leucoagaricus sp. SymC.cos]|nr:14-3-3-like protein GF14 mu [Leucoagaricus sp. SymC.cos]
MDDGSFGSRIARLDPEKCQFEFNSVLLARNVSSLLNWPRRLNATRIKFIVNQYGAQLTIDERNLLSIAYKNLTNSLRNSWRILDSVEKLQQMKTQPSPRLKQEMNLVRRQREKIEKELAEVCKDIVSLLDRQLLPSASAGEETVFYSKMKGDYFRYLAEFALKKDRERYGEQSLNAYKVAYKHAQAMLEPLHPTRLGLALNFSVFYHDVRKSPERACHLAKSAFDDAIQSLDQANIQMDQTMRDSLTILQLLRDDLILWAAELRNQ